MTNLSERDVRQRDLLPPEKLKGTEAWVIGTGALGRQVAVLMAVAGIHSLRLFDDDTVNVENLSTQGWEITDLNTSKVVATRQAIRRLRPDMEVETVQSKFLRAHAGMYKPKDRKLAIFSCVDGVDTNNRRHVWECTREAADFWADGRMSGEGFRVLASGHPKDDGYYATTFFTQEEAFSGACTQRGTLYGAYIVSGHMVYQFARWLRGEPVQQDNLHNLASAETIDLYDQWLSKQ